MKKTVFLLETVVVTLALFSAAGCASLGGGAKTEPGTLTLTGIPAEYEGKFFLASLYSTDPKVQSLRANPVRSLGTAVADGKVQLPLYAAMKLLPTVYNSGYAGSDTFRVRLLVSDTLQEPSEIAKPDFVLDSVKFENGLAEAEFGGVFSGRYSVTITDIPKEWNGAEAGVNLYDQAFYKWENFKDYYTAVVKNGIVSLEFPYPAKLFRKGESGNYEVYPEISPRLVFLSYNGESEKYQYYRSRFSDLKWENGAITLDFANGEDVSDAAK